MGICKSQLQFSGLDSDLFRLRLDGTGGLLGAPTVVDPNGILTSVVETATGTTITIDSGGVAYTTPATGLSYVWQLRDVYGRVVSPTSDGPQAFAGLLEFAGTLASKNVQVGITVADSAALSGFWAFGGVDYNAANPLAVCTMNAFENLGTGVVGAKRVLMALSALGDETLASSSVGIPSSQDGKATRAAYGPIDGDQYVALTVMTQAGGYTGALPTGLFYARGITL